MWRGAACAGGPVDARLGEGSLRRACFPLIGLVVGGVAGWRFADAIETRPLAFDGPAARRGIRDVDEASAGRRGRAALAQLLARVTRRGMGSECATPPVLPRFAR